jgi:AraC-like DNA-binding protein
MLAFLNLLINMENFLGVRRVTPAPAAQPPLRRVNTRAGSPMASGSEEDWKSRADPVDPGQRVGPLVALPDMLREFGVDPEELLRDRGLPADALASAERRIPYFQLGRLLKSAAERTGCEYFGLLLGQRLGLRHMGTLGEMAGNASTVGESVRTMAVHQRLFSRGALAFVLTEGSRPRSTAPYRRALPARIEFNAEFTGMRFSSALLQQKIPGADRHRFRLFEGQIAATGRNSLLNDVRRALRLQMIHGGAANDRVAQTLEMHRRTLHRRLRESGTTFRQVLDEVRYDTARHFLHTTDMPLMEITISLGYSDVTAFTRAFRRWSGVAPGHLRDGRPGRDVTERVPGAPSSPQ